MVARGRWVLITVAVLVFLSPPVQGQTGTENNAGYIDSATLQNTLRLRLDLGYDNRAASRAEFIYPRAGLGRPGFPRPEPSVGLQELFLYGEHLLGERWSAFAEVPLRWINPEINQNGAGLSDINAGFKYLLLSDDRSALTFQFRTYAPTGEGDRGLGTRHVTFEPALLGCRRFTERLNLESELRLWVPVGGTQFAGNVIRSGLGVNYDLFRLGNVRVIPMLDLVSFTVLDGQVSQTLPSGRSLIRDAAGDFILDVKVGARLRLGESADFYSGYGRPVTGDRWYENGYRFEFRLRF